MDEPPERARVERADRELDRLVHGQGADEPGDGLVRLATPHGRDHLRAPGLEAAQDERQHRRAGRVEPLPVVDGEQHAARQRLEQREAGEADQSRVDRVDRGLEQQRSGQRPPLRLREPRQALDGRPEQIVERGERARRLGGGRPRPQHARPALLPPAPRWPRAGPSCPRRRRPPRTRRPASRRSRRPPAAAGARLPVRRSRGWSASCRLLNPAPVVSRSRQPPAVSIRGPRLSRRRRVAEAVGVRKSTSGRAIRWVSRV